MDDYESLSHSAWDCKYHVIFIPKCRRKALYVRLRPHLGEVFRSLANQKEARKITSCTFIIRSSSAAEIGWKLLVTTFQLQHHVLIRPDRSHGKYPPAKPGALCREPLKAAIRGR